LAAKGSAKIITIAQKITSAMATATCSLVAFTAPAMAMAPETPQIAPPEPRQAQSLRSSLTRG
jgi:hypothetical protein